MQKRLLQVASILQPAKVAYAYYVVHMYFQKYSSYKYVIVHYYLCNRLKVKYYLKQTIMIFDYNVIYDVIVRSFLNICMYLLYTIDEYFTCLFVLFRQCKSYFSLRLLNEGGFFTFSKSRYLPEIFWSDVGTTEESNFLNKTFSLTIISQ